MSSDPYVYPGTTVLKNIPGIRNQEILDRFEADRVGQRSLELIECRSLDSSILNTCGEFTVICFKTSTSGPETFERQPIG